MISQLKLSVVVKTIQIISILRERFLITKFHERTRSILLIFNLIYFNVNFLCEKFYVYNTITLYNIALKIG